MVGHVIVTPVPNESIRNVMQSMRKLLPDSLETAYGNQQSTSKETRK